MSCRLNAFKTIHSLLLPVNFMQFPVGLNVLADRVVRHVKRCRVHSKADLGATGVKNNAARGSFTLSSLTLTCRYLALSVLSVAI